MQTPVSPLQGAITFPLQVLIEALMGAWRGSNQK